MPLVFCPAECSDGPYAYFAGSAWRRRRAQGFFLDKADLHRGQYLSPEMAVPDAEFLVPTFQ